MELGKDSVTNGKITCDMNAVRAEGFDLTHGLSRYFKSGQLSFNHDIYDHDIYDAVAISRGIDKEGHLDMAMLKAVEATETYLEDRQGQPVVIVESTYKDTELRGVDARVGVLSLSGKLVGTFASGGNAKTAGIEVQGYVYEVSAYKPLGRFRLDRCDRRDNAQVLPLSCSSYKLGTPGYASDTEDYTHSQDVLAGDDILPWIIQQFGEGVDAYEVFTGIVQAVESAEAKDYLLKEPFVATLHTELDNFQRIADVLTKARAKIDRHSRAIDGAKAEASLELAEIREAAADYAIRLPFTRNSYRINVAEEVQGTEDIDGRLSVLTQEIAWLTRISLGH